MRALALTCVLSTHAFKTAINRREVVSSYNVKYSAAVATDLDRFAALTIGNGAFAINVDPTGLQTIPQVVSAFSLNTLSDWQFHSIPASSPFTCAEVPENGLAVVTCEGTNNTIASIVFSSYGAPTGSCSSGFARSPTCDAANSTAIAAAACVGRRACSLPALNSAYGDPCLGTPKRLAVQVTCAAPPPPPSRAAFLDQYRYSFYSTPISANATVSRPFATDQNISGGVQSWPMVNPHRVGMGELALRQVPPGAAPGTPDPPMLPPSYITNLSATLDVWAGGVTSAFTMADAQGGAWALTIATSIHPDVDLVATALTCAPAPGATPAPGVGCPAALRLGFAYADGAWGPSANAWGADPSLHTTAVLHNDTRSAALTLERVMDDAAWTVSCQWDSSEWLAAKAAGLEHEVLWLPPPGAATTSIALSCLWTPAGLAYPIGMATSAYVQGRVAAAGALLAQGAPRLPLQPAVQAASAAMWELFWAGGSFVHLLASGTQDPRAAELERRVVLSRFLTRSSSAGACPPQETGLLSNSWSGKFHLEMRFWHQAHWALWGNPELLHRSTGFFLDLLPNATSLARFQGYKGARWLKMLGLAQTHNASGAVDVAWLGTAVEPAPAWAPPGSLLVWESFNGINPVLQWQQPHMIWLADAQRRAVNASQGAAAAAALMQELAPLVYATADYLASAPFFNETSGFYELGPPLLGGEEFGDFTRISRATFETTCVPPSAFPEQASPLPPHTHPLLRPPPPPFPSP